MIYSSPVLILFLSGFYFAVLLPILITFYHMRTPGSIRPSFLWWFVFLFLWPLGHFIYAIIYIPKKSYTAGSFMGIFWILFAVVVGIAAASALRKEIKATLLKCGDQISKTVGLTKDQKADLNGNIMILINEVRRTRLFEIDKQMRQKNLANTLCIYLQDNKVSPEELNFWNYLYKNRNPTSLQSTRPKSGKLRF